MVSEVTAAVLLAPNQLCYLCFNALFVTYFVHNVSVTVSDDQKELLDVRTAITHLELDKDFFFNESDAKYLLQIPDQAHDSLFPVSPMTAWPSKTPTPSLSLPMTQRSYA